MYATLVSACLDPMCTRKYVAASPSQGHRLHIDQSELEGNLKGGPESPLVCLEVNSPEQETTLPSCPKTWAEGTILSSLFSYAQCGLQSTS